MDPTPPFPQSDWEPARPFLLKELSVFSQHEEKGSLIKIALHLKASIPFHSYCVLPFSQARGEEARSDKVITASYCLAEKMTCL